MHDVDPAQHQHRQSIRPLTGDPLNYLVALLVIVLGVAAVVYGEADDSPGLQLIGVVLIVGAVGLGIRTARRRR
jgi:uncharacterized membrane protein